MNQTADSAATPAAFVPLRFAEASWPARVLAVVLGTLVLAVASRIEVPMFPVPMTMQTYALVMIGALYGWRLGGITVAAWLLEGAAGLPVLAGGAAGAQHFVGPTGGYLFAFPLMTMLAGWLAERGWTNGHLVKSVAAMLAAHALCLGLGTAWLAVMIGAEKAVAAGLVPFLLGDSIKAVLAAATVEATRRLRRAA